MPSKPYVFACSDYHVQGNETSPDPHSDDEKCAPIDSLGPRERPRFVDQPSPIHRPEEAGVIRTLGGRPSLREPSRASAADYLKLACFTHGRVIFAGSTFLR
jgi:hypothetical protein